MSVEPPLSRLRGMTLVELLVATVTSLLLVAALLSYGRSSLLASRSALAHAQLSEDAQAAVRLISGWIEQSGFVWPIAAPASGPVQHRWSSQQAVVWGCDGGFRDPHVALPGGEGSAAWDVPVDFMPTACRGGDGPDSISLRYEVDVANAFVDDRGRPTDCLGKSLPGREPSLSAPASKHYFVAQPRLYVADGALHCVDLGADSHAHGSVVGQPLVHGVIDLQVGYGLIRADAPDGAGIHHGVSSVQTYGSATQVGAQAAWARVAAIRFCLVMASADDDVYIEPSPYWGCQDAPVMPADRRAYTVMTQTIPLSSRWGPRWRL